MNMKKRNLVALVAALVGSINAIYLSWLKLSHNESLCAPGLGDCFTVNTSRYSEVYGIPIAIFGLGAFLLILFVLLTEERIAFVKENADMILFGVSLIGVLYSAYLTYLEAYVIHAWCPYCVLSAIMITIVFVVSIIRLKEDF